MLRKWWFWTVIGVVAAGTVITAVALTSASSSASNGNSMDLSSVTGDLTPGVIKGMVE